MMTSELAQLVDAEVTAVLHEQTGEAYSRFILGALLSDPRFQRKEVLLARECCVSSHHSLSIDRFD